MSVRAAVLLFTFMLSACAAELPSPIRDEIAATSREKPGATTIVFFTDFQCPHCRRTHAALAPLLRDRDGRVRVVLRHVPLPRHPDARTAARAAVCVERLTRSPPGGRILDEYAQALFAAPDLSEAACEELAVEHGVDRSQYQRCLADRSTDAQIERDLASFDAVRGDGVPLMYLGRTRLDGAQSRDALEAVLDRELSQK